jgi:hypothetical protein
VLTKSLAPVAQRSQVKAAENVDVAKYAGSYRDPNTEEIVRIELRDGKLFVGSNELVPTGNNTLFDTRRNVALTATEEKGALQMRVPGSDLPFTVYTKIEEVKPDAAKLAEYAGTYTSPELDVTYQMVVQNGALVIKRHMQSDLTLAPTFADGFSNFGYWVFTRDGSGKVNGVLLSQGRIRRVRFLKQ